MAEQSAVIYGLEGAAPATPEAPFIRQDHLTTEET